MGPFNYTKKFVDELMFQGIHHRLKESTDPDLEDDSIELREGMRIQVGEDYAILMKNVDNGLFLELCSVEIYEPFSVEKVIREIKKQKH